MQEGNYFLHIDGKPVRVSEEVYREYKRSEEKERYFMKRLKRGRFIVDAEEQNIDYIPAVKRLMNSSWKRTGSSRHLQSR
ncbi:hypothetical protein AALB47_20955 [Lachnospiraceae bacterium 54-11]